MSAAPRSDAAGLPVRPGEEPWTAAELDQVRAELEDEAEGLRADIAKATHDIAEGLNGRIDAGTYGVCESCGQPIGKARLLAFPRATLCVACKQRQERR
jgi:DnaK suppressor protein